MNMGILLNYTQSGCGYFGSLPFLQKVVEGIDGCDYAPVLLVNYGNARVISFSPNNVKNILYRGYKIAFSLFPLVFK